MQQDLFGDIITDIVTVKSVKQYSKEQKEFQKLCEKIEKEKSALFDLKIKLENALLAYNAKVTPIEKKRNQSLFKVLKAIDATYQKFKYSNKIKEMIVETIDEMLLDIAYDFSKDEEFDLLYKKYNDLSDMDDEDFDDEDFQDKDSDDEDFENTEEFFEMMKQNVVEMAYKNFGIRIDLSDIENGPGMDEKIAAKVEEALFTKGIKNDGKKNQKSKTKKKTKKQIEKEEAEKILNEIKDKSLKSIYVSLAKALHPDLEQDEDQKLIKQELMKLVTIAYRNNDLQELLNLQLKWVHNESNHLETLSTNQLKVYIQLLKEKLSMCLDEKQALLYQPRFFKIKNYVLFEKSKTFKNMDEEISEIEKDIEKLNAAESKILNAKTGKFIKDFVEAQYEAFNDQMYSNPFGW
jgi:hypothetical protein